MKKMLAMLLTLLMMGSLVACGGDTAVEDESADPVDLTAFYNELAEQFIWVDDTASEEEFTEESTLMMDPAQDAELLDGYFPGLSDINSKQMVIRTSSNSFLVNEMVFLECEAEEETAKAMELLQNRIDMQVDGGAFYPESVAVWETAEVISNGNYVAMIASAEHQAEVANAFNALFA